MFHEEEVLRERSQGGHKGRLRLFCVKEMELFVTEYSHDCIYLYRAFVRVRGMPFWLRLQVYVPLLPCKDAGYPLEFLYHDFQLPFRVHIG